jgi:hypothetical protein
MCGELVAFSVFGYGNGFRRAGDCRIGDAHAIDVAIFFFFAYSLISWSNVFVQF